MSEQTEWEKFRAQGIGSSDVAAILGLSPWMTKLQLWLYKTGAEKQPDISNQFQVRRGVENEGKARAQIELMAGEAYAPALRVHKKYAFMRVSLDGQTECEKRICEIKVPGKETFARAEKGEVPDYYMAQIQYQLMVSEAEKCLFFCFHPESGKHAQVWVEPDPAWFAKLRDAVIEFWDLVQSKVPPEASDKDYVRIPDPLGISTRYVEMKQKLREMDAELEAMEVLIKELATHPASIVGSLRVTRYGRRGTIDYKKVPELQGVDLEPYRKAPTTQTRITVLQ